MSKIPTVYSKKLVKTVNSGYFRLEVPSDVPVAGAICVLQREYGGTIGSLSLVLTCQPQEAWYNVYVRNGDGTLPTDGGTVQFSVIATY